MIGGNKKIKRKGRYSKGKGAASPGASPGASPATAYGYGAMTELREKKEKKVFLNSL